MIEIKPCPFCGKPGMLTFKSGDYGYTQNTVSIGCKDCRVHFVASAETWVQGIGHIDIRAKAEQKILEKWNTRYGD